MFSCLLKHVLINCTGKYLYCYLKKILLFSMEEHVKTEITEKLALYK